jgi:hypothetical protein
MKLRELLYKVDEKDREKKLLDKVDMILDSILVPARGVVKKSAIFDALGDELGYDLSQQSKQEFWAFIERKFPYQTLRYNGQYVLRGKKLKGSEYGFLPTGEKWNAMRDRINKRAFRRDQKNSKDR